MWIADEMFVLWIMVQQTVQYRHIDT